MTNGAGMDPEPGRPDSAGVAVRPPLLYLGALAAAIVAEAVIPLGRGLFEAPLWQVLAGAVLVVTGASLLVAAVREFVRAGTTVQTHLPSTQVVKTGPYRCSRNPIYVALTIIYCGLAVIAAAWWAFVFLPVVLAIMTVGVIRREEDYLLAKFGGAYADYKRRVRRWL